MSADTQIALKLYQYHSPVLNDVMIFITVLSNGGWFWVLLTVIYLVRKKTRQEGYVLGSALLIDGLLVNCIIKPLVMRDRPFETLGLPILINSPAGSSFPSGHASIAAAFAFSYFMLAHTSRQKKLRWFYLLIAILTAVSRVYLSVHYPSDVIAGALIGFLVAWGCTTVYKKIQKKKKRVDTT